MGGNAFNNTSKPVVIGRKRFINKFFLYQVQPTQRKPFSGLKPLPIIGPNSGKELKLGSKNNQDRGLR